MVEVFGPAVVGGVATLRYDATGQHRAMRCTAGALRDGLALLPPSTHVALVPLGADPPDAPAVTTVPVTDAVKRVRDGLVVETVDRTPLRFLIGPALVHRATLDDLVAGRGDDEIVLPLAAEVIAR